MNKLITVMLVVGGFMASIGVMAQGASVQRAPIQELPEAAGAQVPHNDQYIQNISEIEPLSAEQNLKHAPRLVVNIVVGQMRYDYLLRFADNFSSKGFNALTNNGISCKGASYDYLFTTTNAGLATIATGANPTTHGIIGDSWYNYTTGNQITVAQDKSCYTVGGDDYDAQVSPRSMSSGTLGDCLKGVSPMSKVISVGFEPASAVIMGGFTADAAYWLNAKNGNWVTSTYYMGQLPTWVNNFNDLKLSETYSAKPWTVLKPMSRYHNIISKDIIRDTTVNFFSFETFTRRRYDYPRFAASPMANTLIKDFAVQAIIYENLGKDENTDIINIVFDPQRSIGKKYGSHSVEIEDAYYRLDLELGYLLEFLQTQVGVENTLVIVTSDQGASDAASESSRMPQGRFNATQFSVLINGFLGAKLGDSERWVLDFTNNQVYLNRPLIYQKGHNLTQIQNDVAAFAIQFRGVAHAITASSLQSGISNGVMSKAQNSYFPRHSGDVMLNLLPGWTVENDNLSQGGSGYTYDVHVPLIFWGKCLGTDLEGESRKVLSKVKMCDIAPTTANILGIAPPNSSTGEAIF